MGEQLELVTARVGQLEETTVALRGDLCSEREAMAMAEGVAQTTQVAPPPTRTASSESRQPAHSARVIFAPGMVGEAGSAGGLRLVRGVQTAHVLAPGLDGLRAGVWVV